MVYTPNLFECSIEEVRGIVPEYLDRNGLGMIKEELQFLLDQNKTHVQFDE